MRRILRFFSHRPAPAVKSFALSAEQHQELLRILSEVGLGIVAETRGPVPLLTFGRRMLDRLGTERHGVPLPDFTDALKRVINEMDDQRLRVMSPSDFVGVGYVYNADDPETWPVRSGR